jgi:hypothetical protein
MATAGAVIGNSLLLYMEGNPIACTTDATFDFSRVEFSVTCKDNNGAEQIRLGGTQGTFGVSGIWKFDATYGVEDLVTAFLAATPLTARWSTDETGDFYLEAETYITNISGSSPVNDAVSFDATFKITGPITKGDNT